MKKVYILILLALAVASCQDIKIDLSETILDGQMHFNVTTSAQTKVAGLSFEESDQIGLYVTDYLDDDTPMPLQISGNRANNLSVTFDGLDWTPEQAIYWGSGKADVYAYYPLFEIVEDINDQYFEVAADQTEGGYEASDLLWAKADGVRQEDGTVNLAMQHVMSKLTVKLVAGEAYVGSLPEEATVHLHSTVTGARVNLENGAVTKDPYCSAKSIKMKNLGIRTVADGGEAVVYEAIVLPQMLESSVPLLEINSKSVSYLLEDSFNFRPGTAYTYTVTLNTSTTAIKVEIGCELEDWNNGGGDSGGGDGEGGEDGDAGEDDEIVYSDLSAGGTANCYLIQEAGDYKFKAVIGNSDATVGNVKTVEVLWESFGTDVMPNVGDLISSASYKDGYIRFSTPETFKDGNAVVAAKNSKGVILWSWHIWCAVEGWQEQVYYNDAGTMMDRNLGATSATPGDVGAFGLLYQWGRKDPFLGAASMSVSSQAVSTGNWSYYYNGSVGSSISMAESNPMVFYGNLILQVGNWDSLKTVNDPCPSGWMIPEGGKDGVWATAIGSEEKVKLTCDWLNKGINFSGLLGDAESIWYPFSGLIGASGLFGALENGRLFTVSGDYNYNTSGEVWPSGHTDKLQGSSVRCIKQNLK